MLKTLRAFVRARFSTNCQLAKSVPCFTMRPILHEEYNSDFFNSSLGELQDILSNKGFLQTKTDNFNAEIREAVKAFQTSANLVPDGIVGPLTWAALLYPTLDINNRAVWEDATEHVIMLQTRLNEEKFKVKVDGCFNRKTKQALKRFQVAHALRADGVCGPRSWSILLGQRQVLSRRLSRNIMDFLEGEWLIIEQLLMVASIQIGILFNPFESGHRYPFWTTLAVSYVLAYVGPLVLENKISFLLDELEGKKAQVLRWAPYVLIGFLSRQILHVIKIIIIP